MRLRNVLCTAVTACILICGNCKKKDQEIPEQVTAERSTTELEYVGRQSCIDCHKKQYDLYVGSDHDMAMDVATGETVLGDFNDVTFDHFGISSHFYKKAGKHYVHTEGPDGKFEDYEIKYTFGIRPLQQYLIEFPGGAYQCLPLCWDTRPREQGGQRWFHIYAEERILPSDVLYWTHITQNWNYMCSECHSTNLRKNFDRFSETYNTTWSEIDVSCEACHGPCSEHVKWAEAADKGQTYQTTGYLGLAIRLKEVDGATWVFKDPEKGTAERTIPRNSNALVEMCARCHARRTLIHEEYVHNRSFLDTHMPSVLEEQLYFPDGQILEEVYVYGSFLQSKMYTAGVNCKDCHEPHSGKVFIQGNALCYRCHLLEKYGTKDHHFHKDESTGALCVECHMVERSYMVVDPRRDHSMQTPRPDLSDKLETPNACIRCHDHKDKSNQWAAEYCQKWYRDLQEGQTHYGESFYDGRRGYPEARAGLLVLASNVNNPPMVRSTALHLLQGYPDRGSLSVLKEAIKDPDPLIRASAVQSFGMINEEERFPLLKNLLRDPVRLVRVRTAFALAGTPRDSLSTGERTLLDQVLEEYKQVQYYNADHPTAHLNLGVLATLQGNYDEAGNSYRKAIEKEPVLPFGYINLADLYRAQGREADGEAILLSALENNPNLADIHHALGLLYVRIKKQKEALSHIKKAAELEPENSRYSYVYGIALNSNGQIREALAFLEIALERHPYDRELLYALATINRDQGNIEDALKYTRRLIEAYPQIPTFRQLEQLLIQSQEQR